MHELALMEEVRRIALEEAASQGGNRIHALRLRLGRLSGVDPDALRFAFEVVMAKEIAAGARLDLEVVPTLCRCGPCGSTFEPEDVILICPRCGSPAAEVLAGRELELIALEVS